MLQTTTINYGDEKSKNGTNCCLPRDFWLFAVSSKIRIMAIIV
jgi:hypothetical protein